MLTLFGESGSSTSEGAGERGPTGMRSGTVFKVGMKEAFLICRDGFFLGLRLMEDDFLHLTFLLVSDTWADLICLGGVLEVSMVSSVFSTGGGVEARSSSISMSEMPVTKSSGSLNRCSRQSSGSLNKCSRQFLRSSSSSQLSGGGRGGEKGGGGEVEDMRMVSRSEKRGMTQEQNKRKIQDPCVKNVNEQKYQTQMYNNQRKIAMEQKNRK
mgnify:CR=1 FL=1